MAVWLGAIALSVFMAVALTMVQMINRHSGFRPYVIHTAWAAWLFFSMVLVWWRAPLLVTDGWDYLHLLVVSAGPLAVFLAWTFLAPSGTEGSAEAAKAQYFDKAPQGFGVLAFVAAWAIVINLWLVDGTTAVVAAVGWAVALVLFIALTRSRDVRLHVGAVTFMWILLLGEYIFELERGVPSL